MFSFPTVPIKAQRIFASNFQDEFLTVSKTLCFAKLSVTLQLEDEKSRSRLCTKRRKLVLHSELTLFRSGAQWQNIFHFQGQCYEIFDS
jgi:hypothetical protein